MAFTVPKNFGGWGPSAGKTKYQNKGKFENFKCRALLCLGRWNFTLNTI